jgi:hypothetical protein
MVNKPEFFAEKQAAEYIGMSVAFLRCGRLQGNIGNRTPSPPFYRKGTRVQYSRADLDAWLAARRVDPAARRAPRRARRERAAIPTNESPAGA